MGPEILYPFTCNTGKTAPSVLGDKNLLKFQLAASGPDSASPSPIKQTLISSGLSNTEPVATANEYPSSPPSSKAPGASGFKCDGYPKGVEKFLMISKSPSLV